MHKTDVSAKSAMFSARSLGRFLVVGGFSTAVHYLTMALLCAGVAISAAFASTVGFVFGAVSNYLLNRRFTFGSTQAHKTSAPRFLITAVCGLLLNYVILSVLLAFSVHVLPAQIFSTIGVIAWNYCIHSVWTFKTARA